MAGLSVGILGAGGVGIATAGALIQQGLAGRVTIYARNADHARGEALDFLHAPPLLPHTEIRGRGIDELEPEDVLVITVGHHTKPGESRLDILENNLVVIAAAAEAIEQGGLPRIAIVVSNPLDVLTEYLTRRWADRPVAVMGSGTSLDTLRFNERIAQECGVHPRSVHAWVIGEHGDSQVFLHESATIGALPLREFAKQRDLDLTPEWFSGIEADVRSAAYQVRELKGSTRHGIALAVSGLIRCIGRETGTIIPVSVRVGDRRLREPPVRARPRRPERAAVADHERDRARRVGPHPRRHQRADGTAADLTLRVWPARYRRRPPVVVDGSGARRWSSWWSSVLVVEPGRGAARRLAGGSTRLGLDRRRALGRDRTAGLPGARPRRPAAGRRRTRGPGSAGRSRGARGWPASCGSRGGTAARGGPAPGRRRRRTGRRHASAVNCFAQIASCSRPNSVPGTCGSDTMPTNASTLSTEP